MRKKPKKLSDVLREAIASDEMSRYRLSQLTGIDNATLSRFLNRKGGLSIEGIDAIAEALGLRLTSDRPKPKKG